MEDQSLLRAARQQVTFLWGRRERERGGPGEEGGESILAGIARDQKAWDKGEYLESDRERESGLPLPTKPVQALLHHLFFSICFSCFSL